MKNSTKLLLSTFIFLSVFFGFYLLLSMAGMMFKATYTECIGSVGWFIVYFCCAVPLAGIIARDFYDEH
jgi:hypothetical protein